MNAAQPPTAGPADDTADSSAARSTLFVSVAILCSRVLGLVREMVFHGLFGAGKLTDAFWVAFKIPNLMRDMFAEGALSHAFVTTFTKKMKNEGDAPAWELARKMATLAIVFMSGVVLLGILLAPLILRIMVPEWEGEKLDFTILLARIMFPFIGVVSLSALVMGMLNAKGRFFIPALASSFFNLGSIAGGVLLGYLADPGYFRDPLGSDPRVALTCFAVGTLVGGLAQLVVQLPSVYRAGFRFRPDFGWRDSGVRKVLSLMGPAVIAAGAVQVNVALNVFFASFLEEGSVTYLQVSFRLMQLPLGVFGVAVGMVTLPAVSRAASEGITPEFGRILAKGLRLVLLLTLPSALGLWLLAGPIISLIYERGKFTGADSQMAALSLQTYAIGLVFYAGIKVVQPAFYAIDKRWVPMMVSFAAIGVNVVLNSLFIFVLDKGHEFLALSTSIGAVVNFAVLYMVMRRHAGTLETRRIAVSFAKVTAGCAVLVAVCWYALGSVLEGFGGFGIGHQIVALGATVAVAAAGFFAVVTLLRLDEMGDFVALIKRRLLRK